MNNSIATAFIIMLISLLLIFTSNTAQSAVLYCDDFNKCSFPLRIDII